MVREDKIGWVHDDVHIGRDGRLGQGHLGWEEGLTPSGAADRRAEMEDGREDEEAIQGLEAELRRFYSIFGNPGDFFQFISADALTCTHSTRKLTACIQMGVSLCAYVCS